MPPGALSDSRATDRQVAIMLTAGFQVTIAGRPIGLPHSVERVLAFLALSDRPVNRTRIAGILWIDATDSQASSNLRTALWRLHRSESEVVVTEADRVALAPDVWVDYGRLVDLAHDLIDRSDIDNLNHVTELINAGDLLPDWDDEWVVADRERLRLLRLEALERAATQLLRRGLHGYALRAALGASRSEPLRESARRLLIQVHLAEGNVAEALLAYRDYRETLLDEVGIEPSAAMEALVGPLVSRSTVTRK
jgi:DNA-binding SARP family transcriptional activator